EEPGEGYLNLAWRTRDGVEWTHDSEPTSGSVVIPGLESKNFQAADAAVEGSVVYCSTGGSFQRRRCRPVNGAFQRRFDIHAVQSWAFDGELVRGRLFCLDKGRMRLDNLLFGVLI